MESVKEHDSMMNSSRRVFTWFGMMSLAIAIPRSAEAAWITYGNSWYNSTSPGLSVFEAESEAQSFGGHLVAINDVGEQNFLSANYQGDYYFIGLTDEAVEGVYVWMNGDPLTYTNWAAGEPNNSAPSGEDYVLMNWNGPGRWNDGDIGWRRRGIIEVANQSPDVSLAPLGPVEFGDLVVFDASASYDVNEGLGDEITSYQWNVAGSLFTTTDPMLSFDTSLLGSAGSYEVTLTAVDRLGASGLAAMEFDVGALSSVPEPSSLGLLGMGLVCLVGRRLRRKS